VLGRYAFPDLTLGVGDPTMERIRAHPGEAQRELRHEDARNYVVRLGPLSLGNTQSLPVPGYIELGNVEIELHRLTATRRMALRCWPSHTGCSCPATTSPTSRSPGSRPAAR